MNTTDSKRHASGKRDDITIGLRAFAIALVVLVSVPAAAQAPDALVKQAKPTKQQIEHAKARCRLNHGVDCDTPNGLKEWLQQERSREEAVGDGSRHLPAAEQGSAQTRK